MIVHPNPNKRFPSPHESKLPLSVIQPALIYQQSSQRAAALIGLNCCVKEKQEQRMRADAKSKRGENERSKAYFIPSSHPNRFQSQLSDSLTRGFSPCPAWQLKRKFIFSSQLVGFRKNHPWLTATSFWWAVIFLGTWQFVLWLLDRKAQQPTEWAVASVKHSDPELTFIPPDTINFPQTSLT